MLQQCPCDGANLFKRFSAVNDFSLQLVFALVTLTCFDSRVHFLLVCGKKLKIFLLFFLQNYVVRPTASGSFVLLLGGFTCCFPQSLSVLSKFCFSKRGKIVYVIYSVCLLVGEYGTSLRALCCVRPPFPCPGVNRVYICKLIKI